MKTSILFYNDHEVRAIGDEENYSIIINCTMSILN